MAPFNTLFRINNSITGTIMTGAMVVVAFLLFSGNVSTVHAGIVLYGFNCSATGFNSAVSSGSNHIASGNYSSISGGFENEARAFGTFIGAGGFNRAQGIASFVGAGVSNNAIGAGSFVGAGVSNNATGTGSFVGAGFNNTATGVYSYIGGGENNQATGKNSIAMGKNANAKKDRSLVINLGNNEVSSKKDGEFLVNSDSFTLQIGKKKVTIDKKNINKFKKLLKRGNRRLGEITNQHEINEQVKEQQVINEELNKQIDELNRMMVNCFAQSNSE